MSATPLEETLERRNALFPGNTPPEEDTQYQTAVSNAIETFFTDISPAERDALKIGHILTVYPALLDDISRFKEYGPEYATIAQEFLQAQNAPEDWYLSRNLARIVVMTAYTLLNIDNNQFDISSQKHNRTSLYSMRQGAVSYMLGVQEAADTMDCEPLRHAFLSTYYEFLGQINSQLQRQAPQTPAL